MTTIRIKLPKITDIGFELTAEFENDISVRGNALASGNNEEDKKCEDRIISRLHNGDLWAWASVKVTASYKGLTAHEYLGCCSYKDETDFIKNSGYYEDMKQDTYNAIVAQIKELK